MRIRTILIGMVSAVSVCGYAETNESLLPGVETGHEYVDLGLPSGALWATYNIGATTDYESGLYFAWGETDSRESFSVQSYPYVESEEIPETGSPQYYFMNIGESISATEYDVARQNWGGFWRIPTVDEFSELIEQCQCEWKDEKKMTGLQITGPNGNSIFLPVNFPGNTVEPAVLGGQYWTGMMSEENGTDLTYAMSMYFTGSDPRLTPDCRFKGKSIRAVIGGEDTEMGVKGVSEVQSGIRYEDGKVYVDRVLDGSMLMVSDMSGRTLLTVAVDGRGHDISGLSKGVYMVSVCKAGTVMNTLKIYKSR